MRIFLLLLFLSSSGYSYSIDEIQETTIILKYRLAKDILPYLKPHLAKDGRMSGLENKLTIRSKKSNIDELFAIIGDLDRIDYKKIIISISMNMKAAHNVNTRSIEVGDNTWTKINYGVSYSKRIRETLPNGHLIEKIKYVKVIESFQIHTKIDDTNKNLKLKLRATQDDSDLNAVEEINIEETNIDELSDNNLQINIKGNINEWIGLGDAIKSLYISSDEDAKTQRERQTLTKNLGIKVQILQ